MKKNIVLASMFASLYAVLVIALALISFLPFQVRFADALIPLSILFGWPSIIGLTIGCAVSNFVAGQVFFVGWTFIDVIGGSLANFVSCYVGWKICIKHTSKFFLTSTLIQSIIVSIIVGTYLWFIFGSPERYDIYSFVLPGLPAFWLSIFIGSFIAIVLLGNLLLTAILKSKLYPIEKR